MAVFKRDPKSVSTTVYMRENGEIVTKKITDLKPFGETEGADTTSDFKNALSAVINTVTNNTYVNADIIYTYDLNEETAG